jgi:hypothetical protein
MNINEIKPNPNNPRIIRPIVIDENNIVLGGNMRLKACIEAGLKDVPVKQAKQLTEQQKKEFIVKDNVGYGEWDWDDFANNWDEQLLTEWGLDIPNFDSGGFADQNKELSLDDVSDSMTITLKYTEDEYHLIKEQLHKIAATPEQAIWKLLGND